MGGNRSGVLKVYNTLLRHFGPQRWWPIQQTKGEPQQPGLSDDKRFEICAGAILTQNTSWKNVEGALANLLDSELLSAQAMQRVPESELAELIKPAGYYNQKAERLKLFARALANWRSEPSREALLNITGIGPETADSMLLYAYDQPYFVIDAYTRRVFSRLGLTKEDMEYEDMQALFHDSILPKEENVGIYKEFHALIVRLCKEHCKKTPLCGDCPLEKGCKKQSVKT
jgi:endonuclease-3 related protein